MSGQKYHARCASTFLGVRPDTNSAGILCHQDLGQGGSVEIHQESHKKAPRARSHRDRRLEGQSGDPKSTLPPRKAGEGAAIEPPGLEFTPVIGTRKTGHGRDPANKDATEIQLSPRLGPQPLQSGSSPQHPAQRQGLRLRCPNGVEAPTGPRPKAPCPCSAKKRHFGVKLRLLPEG